LNKLIGSTDVTLNYDFLSQIITQYAHFKGDIALNEFMTVTTVQINPKDNMLFVEANLYEVEIN
jgi:hypothetical protein